jgi:hypothetical protein
MKPARIVLTLFLGWLTVQIFPQLGWGWPGFLLGCAGVFLLYVLLSSSPEPSKGTDTKLERREQGRD